MLSFKTLTTTLLLLSALVIAHPNPGHDDSDSWKGKKCPTCDPISGQNKCDITTSCISTGTDFHCACRAGYKASKHDNSHKQFRLPFKNYEFLVFVPENTPCDVLCDDALLPPPQLCSEVRFRDQCPA
ncbi:hypothetical protein AJ80_00423 [Polytolypa hystricis UAMH7299]|uniref:Adhesin n=1 Tax=Polytolypa hystricis (strain UAMH7299) TaxID=1447883 RepID=A0A2B7Z3R1_POLH7|nr:hypothetical protein AJ80_00423 [Polytolypa hystricis UAMH7299]